MTEQSITVNIKNATINLAHQEPTFPGALGATIFGLDWGRSTNTSSSNGESLEVRDLCDGKEVSPNEALKALAELGDGWRLETPHELFAKVDYGFKNANGAYSRDESIKKGWYWTSQESPAFEGARVVVGFGLGNVDLIDGGNRCLARAVRVARQ